MFAEHSFITTLEMDQALALVRQFLQALNFYQIESPTPGKITAIRGKKRPSSRTLTDLPQAFEMEFDRGRVNIAFSGMPRIKRNLPVHSEWLIAFLNNVETLLNENPDINAAVAEFRNIEQVTGKIWHTSEKLAYGCFGLILFGLFLLIVIAMVSNI